MQGCYRRVTAWSGLRLGIVCTTQPPFRLRGLAVVVVKGGRRAVTEVEGGCICGCLWLARTTRDPDPSSAYAHPPLTHKQLVQTS